MKRPVRVLIPTGFGLNCEEETARAFRMVGAEVDLIHLTDLFARRHGRKLTDYQVLAFIGGFSYGDHVAGGLVLATRIRAHLMVDLQAFLGNGGRVLGICNGFQTLVRLGLLPGPEAGPADRAEQSWVAWRVHRALEQLPESERSVLELAYWSGLSQSEIAEFLGIPLGTVKTRTRSGLRRLADELEGQLE